MTNFPVFVDPPGDPSGVRASARILTDAAASLSSSSRRLSEASRETTRVWESTAQQMFTILAEGFTSVIAGTSEISGLLAEALNRYAATLETCQNDVRQARHRLQVLVASTPAGMLVDPSAMAAITGQVEQAGARAAQAGRELSATAQSLTGVPGTPGGVRPPSDANASFVSRTHAGSAGLVDTGATAAAFDAQAAQIEQQMGGALMALAGLAGAETNPVPAGLYPSQAMVGGVSFSDSISSPGIGTGASIVGGFSITDGITSGSSGSAIVGGFSLTDGITSGSTGSAIIGGPGNRSGNPTMVLAEAVEARQRRSAERIWNSAMPGVPPPSTDSGAILSELLKRAPNLTPTELAAVGIVNGGNHINITRTLLPAGWELVRDVR